MDIELIDVDSNGDGYCIVHRDDGSTFGQHFYGAPLGSSAVLLDAVTGLVADKAAPQVALVAHVAVPAEIVQLLHVKHHIVPAKAKADPRIV